MILFGASGHAKVILDILFHNEVEVMGIIDDNPQVSNIFEIPVHKNDNLLANEQAIISIGDNGIRKKIAEKYTLQYQQALHPKSTISQFSEIGEGTVVMANAVLNPGCKIGQHCIINTAAIIEHDCVLEDFVHISPNAALAGNVFVGEGTHIGIGASIIQGIKIGKWATIGAGAVIIRDVPDFAKVVGNPGKIIK